MRLLILCLSLLALTPVRAAVMPANCTQAIIGNASGWDSSHVKLSLLEKRNGQWVMVKGPFAGRLGKSGLVWGYGLTSPPKGGQGKREGDLRSPAGVFLLGGCYGTVGNLKKHRSMPYRKVTDRDLWVEDVKSPYYNRHLVLKQPASTPWERDAQMKLNDHAHSIKLFIKHNAPGDPGRPIVNAGSSIFFHIWRRDGGAPTAGCTTMSESDLRDMIAWLDPGRSPVYILLPQQEYLKLRGSWGLP